MKGSRRRSYSPSKVFIRLFTLRCKKQDNAVKNQSVFCEENNRGLKISVINIRQTIVIVYAIKYKEE